MLVHVEERTLPSAKLQSEFFAGLPRRGLRWRFSRFDLAAGELPCAGIGWFGAALEQDPIAIAKDEQGHVEGAGGRHGLASAVDAKR
jgi:hypothetical protein